MHAEDKSCDETYLVKKSRLDFYILMCSDCVTWKYECKTELIQRFLKLCCNSHKISESAPFYSDYRKGLRDSLLPDALSKNQFLDQSFNFFQVYFNFNMIGQRVQ